MIYIHGGNDPQERFIKEIEISFNGNFVFSFQPFAQENLTRQSFTYRTADLKPGDKVKVKAKCGILESKKETYTAQ